MGGTRCVFRDCQVSTQRNPKMHFFKLPVRDPVRLEAWLKNCGNANILNIEREKLSNRAVCARHFRYECFMNYKLDRLISNQTPTLCRISKELAWDLERLDENGEATMIKLTIPTLSHLIPPENFECPLGFTEDRFGRKYAARRRSPPRPLSMDAIKKQKLTHVKKHEPIKDKKEPDVIDLTAVNTVDTAEVIDEQLEQQESIQKDSTEKMNLEIIREPIKDECPDLIDSIMPTQPLEEIIEDLQIKYDQLKANFDQLSTENDALKQSIVKLEAQAQVCKVKISACSPPSRQLTKSQLYNGIKKYLGATMAALVRMEMFGSAEREWKQDERDFAKELLQLGEGVYTHCCDEWRFRLPSLQMTRSWLHDTNAADDEDQNP